MLRVKEINFLPHPSETNWNASENLTRAGRILPGSSAVSKLQNGWLWGNEPNMVQELSALLLFRNILSFEGLF